MKKIITAAGMIVFVGALIVGGTGAFFSDTETSVGNVFTAGAIDLTVDSEQHYNDMVCANVNGFGGPFVWIPEDADPATFNPAAAAAFNAAYPLNYPEAGVVCDGTWAQTNLGAHKFFNFDDVKPGDEGENTISLHVDSNDAYACVDITITSNDDVTCTDPENDAEGTTTPCNTDGDPEFDGELADNLEFFAWLDDGAIDGFGDEQDEGEGDNIWQEGEVPLFENLVGPASDALDGESYTLADPELGALVGSTTYYIGLAWCAGTMTVEGPGELDCDGESMGNDAQTDEMIADIAFRIEQARNNPDFTCEPEEVEPIVTTLTLAKTVLPALLHPDSAYVLTASSSLSLISGIEGAASVTNASTTPGVYLLSETDGGFPGAVVTWSCVGNATAEVDNGDGTATVTVAAGESVGCDVTNNYGSSPL